jgi:hypothetical protein
MYRVRIGHGDIRDESAFEHAWNVAETTILALLGFVNITGLLGLFGGGPLSHASRRVPSQNTGTRTLMRETEGEPALQGPC